MDYIFMERKTVGDTQREFAVARRTRYFALVACRIGGILFIAFGAMQSIGSLLLYLRWRGSPSPLGAPDANIYWFLAGLATLIPGVVLASASEAIARWIAPAPGFRCLACDYDAGPSGSSVCPECGSPIGVTFQRPTDSDDVEEHARE